MEQRIIEAETQEKRLVKAFFGHKRKGFFVEVGANEPNPLLSQTYHLELDLGWTGILVEPIDRLYKLNCKIRTNARTYHAACTSPMKTGKLKLHIPVENGHEVTVHAGLELGLDFAEQRPTTTQQVDAMTLNSILEEASVEEIDLLSIDVEGTELDVLEGLDFSRYRPKLILLEDRMVYLNKHLHLRKHGYHPVRRTGFNNWYVPDEDTRTFMNLTERLNFFRKLFLSVWVRKAKESLKMKTLRPLLKL